MYSVKEIAQIQGCSETIIYRHIRTYQELKEHTQKKNGRTLIDEEGFQIIRDLMKSNPIVVSEASDMKLIEELRAELQLKQNKIEELQDLVIQAQIEFKELLIENHSLKLEASQTKLLEESNELLKSELESERSRRLSFKEWWQRR